jgi:hypothetical protein
MVKLHMAGTWGDPDGVILGLATSNNRKEWALALKTLAARVVVVDSSGKPVPKVMIMPYLYLQRLVAVLARYTTASSLVKCLLAHTS